MQSASARGLDWARAYGDALPAADIRCQPGDFRVTEILSFEPDGVGDHDYLWVEKTATNTGWVVSELAKYAGVPQRDVGFAGLKDRHAITRQWFSVPRRHDKTVDWGALDASGIRIVDASRHSRKLRRGAHRGNEFQIIVRNISKIDTGFDKKLELLKRQGIANFFGEQRFGRGAANLEAAQKLFDGRRMRRASRSMALSAARAYLFNRVLERRIQDGTWNQLRNGDCAVLDGSNSFFRVDTVDAALRDRCARLDVHPSGPLWGAGEAVCGSEIVALEEAVAAADPDLRNGLVREAKAARRPLRAAVRRLEWCLDGDALELKFSLPRGSYATTVIRELVRYRDAAQSS